MTELNFAGSSAEEKAKRASVAQQGLKRRQFREPFFHPQLYKPLIIKTLQENQFPAYPNYLAL